MRPSRPSQKRCGGARGVRADRASGAWESMRAARLLLEFEQAREDTARELAQSDIELLRKEGPP